jgi:hypothetical protein
MLIAIGISTLRHLPRTHQPLPSVFVNGALQLQCQNICKHGRHWSSQSRNNDLPFSSLDTLSAQNCYPRVTYSGLVLSYPYVKDEVIGWSGSFVLRG